MVPRNTNIGPKSEDRSGIGVYTSISLLVSTKACACSNFQVSFFPGRAQMAKNKKAAAEGEPTPDPRPTFLETIN